jgi:hypothetical protein
MIEVVWPEFGRVAGSCCAVEAVGVAVDVAQGEE